MQLWRGGRLATLAGERGWGLIDDGALLVERDRLRWVLSLIHISEPTRPY